MFNRETNLTTKSERSIEKSWIAPPVDIYENKDEFLIVADLPGVGQNEVRIHYERGQIDLEASGSRPAPAGRLVAGAPLAADYQRSFSVPGTIEVDKIVAELKEGVLFLRLPKSERAKPRQIQVNVG